MKLSHHAHPPEQAIVPAVFISAQATQNQNQFPRLPRADGSRNFAL